MGLAVDVDQLRGIDVGVALHGAQPGVSQQLLDGPQVGAALQQVRRKRMSERVRADAQARAALRDISAQEAIHAAASEARPPVVDEQWILLGATAPENYEIGRRVTP